MDSNTSKNSEPSLQPLINPQVPIDEPISRSSFYKKKFLTMFMIGLVPFLLVVAAGAYYLGTQFQPKTDGEIYVESERSLKSNIISTPIPDPTANWKTYMSSNFSFEYPSSWIDKSDEGDKQQNIIRFIIEDGNEQYYFVVGSGGRGGPPMDEIKSDKPKYGDISFTRRMWIKDNKPFFIVALPDEPYSVKGNIEINFPIEKSDYYVEIFDQILSTFKFTE